MLNWEKGFFRIWIVFSVIWFIAVLVINYISYQQDHEDYNRYIYLLCKKNTEDYMKCYDENVGLVNSDEINNINEALNDGYSSEEIVSYLETERMNLHYISEIKVAKAKTINKNYIDTHSLAIFFAPVWLLFFYFINKKIFLWIKKGFCEDKCSK